MALLIHTNIVRQELMLTYVMLCLKKIHTYTQVNSMKEKTRQVYITNQRKYLLIPVIIKQHRGNNERENKTG